MNYYNKIKNELINNEINSKVKNYSINKSDLNTYYNIGKILSEAEKRYNYKTGHLVIEMAVDFYCELIGNRILSSCTVKMFFFE